MSYFIEEFRILSPQEAIKIYMGGEKIQSKMDFMFYLSTGMRYNEGLWVLDNPDKIDYERRVIHFESNKKWDRENKWRDRPVCLSHWDLINVHNYVSFNAGRRINPRHVTLTRITNNWAIRAGIDPKGIGARSLRKTRFVWLLKAYPDYEDIIIETMDYSPNKNQRVDPSYTNIEDYKKVPFTEKEVKLIESLLCGWSGAPEF
jgi:integrase